MYYKNLLLVIFISLVVKIQAQENLFMTDRDGKPLYFHSNFIADGTPYFNDEYQETEITTMNGTVHRNIKTKINLLENQVLYKTPEGIEVVSIIAIRQLAFVNKNDEGNMEKVVLLSFGQPLNGANSKIYQILDSGNITLLKQIIVTYRDDKKYGESVTTRHFEKKETLFAMVKNEGLRKMEKGKTAMLELLADQKKAVETFISNNGIACKSEDDFYQVIHYYNSIQ